jgi:ATP-dependent Lhr-like helicase
VQTVTRFEAKRQRTDPGYLPAELIDWQEWVKERILIPAAEYVGPETGLVRIAMDGRSWITHPELVHALVTTGLVPAGAVRGSIAPVEDPRDAVQLAREMLSFYGPRTRDQIGSLLPVLPADLLSDGDGWISGELMADSAATWWCDPDNYEILLRFQRAALRPDVAAKPASDLPGWLARWQGFGGSADGDALADALLCLRGYGAPVRVWLEDLPGARFGTLPTGSLDEALRSAELTWFGTGPEAITVGYPEDLALIREAAGGDDPLTGAFADPDAGYTFSQLADRQKEPLDVFAGQFWSAVWRGGLHADSLLPLKQGLERGFALTPLTPPAAGARHYRRGALRAGQRSFAGTWRLLPAAPMEADPLTALETDKERARLLLERYGIVTRELANREGGSFRWSRLFRALAMMELSGEIVAGYFFDGLSGPQFATPAAVAAFLRATPPRTFWMNAVDPASPCGLGLPDPDLPQRRAQNFLSYLDDALALVIENAGSRLTFHLPPEHPRLVEALTPLAYLVARDRRVRVTTINGEDARQSPYLTPIGAILKGVKDHKLITLESR